MTIVGLTPARGGSKGIPGKNIKMIAGKPLLAWTIESAQASHYMDKYYVSTDDKEIAKVAKSYGVDVIDRPPELATDESPVIETLKHFISKVNCDNLVLLQCTSPIRNPNLISDCIKQHVIHNSWHSTATGWMCKYLPYGTNTKRRQDYSGFFYDDGSVYVIYSGLIRQGLLFDDVVGKVLTTREENIEIDDEFDFWLCEQILKRRNNDTNRN